MGLFNVCYQVGGARRSGETFLFIYRRLHRSIRLVSSLSVRLPRRLAGALWAHQ